MTINYDSISNDVKRILANADVAHDFYHVQRVLNTACQLSQGLDVDMDVVMLTALLHDVDDYKLFSENMHHAQSILVKYDIPQSIRDRVLDAVAKIS